MSHSGREHGLLEALEHLRHALELLDAASAPPHIGAHVDLALNELYSTVARSAGADCNEIERTAELQ